MNTDQPLDKLENALRKTGTRIEYPATPSMAQAHTRLRAERSRMMIVRFVAVSAMVLAFALMMIPESRNAIGGWLGAGSLPTATRLTPTLLMTAQTGTTFAPTTAMPPRTGTPTSWCSDCETHSPDIRLLAKPVARPAESIQAK